MRFREMPKRAIFSIPFELADGFVIGVKGYGEHDHDCAIIDADIFMWLIFIIFARYGLVTEQKKGDYKYFIDSGDHLEAVEPKTLYVDKVRLMAHLISAFSATTKCTRC